MPDAKVEQPTDAVIGITTTNICGSDLHMYEAKSVTTMRRRTGTTQVVLRQGRRADHLTCAANCASDHLRTSPQSTLIGMCDEPEE